jgi:hypothetical protein
MDILGTTTVAEYVCIFNTPLLRYTIVYSINKSAFIHTTTFEERNCSPWKSISVSVRNVEKNFIALMVFSMV